MQSEQEFCLRWNDHKSTLITIFESLLESNTLVDCTLAAEGQSLKAHKVVLCACSPYFQFLLTQHTDKHPIVILKDVKFEELRAMIDYMYRGEVNIPEDQLGPLLKAAESLEIRGLGGASVRDKQGEIDKQISKKLVINEKHPHSPKRERYSEISGTRGANGSSRNIQARKKSLSPVPRKRICPTRYSNVRDELQNSKSEEYQQQKQVSPALEITSIPSVPSSSTQNSVSCRPSAWTDIDAKRPSSPVPSSEKDGPPLSALSSFGRPLEEPSGNTNWSDLGLKTSPASPDISRTLAPPDQNLSPVTEVLLVPKTEYVEIDEDSLTNVMLDEVHGIETSGSSHNDGDRGTSSFLPWLQNIEGITHSIVGPETVGNYQSSQVSETSGILTQRRRKIQNRKFNGNSSSRFYRMPSREYRRLRTLRSENKDCMTEDEIEELRRYERKRKRAQRAKKAAKGQDEKSSAFTLVGAPPFNWQ